MSPFTEKEIEAHANRREEVCMGFDTQAGAARNPAWYHNIAAPRFAQYQQKTDRELPIIRLVPRSG